MNYHQKISVHLEYDVIFTRHLFAADNDSLATVLKADHTRPRLVFYVDDGLLSHWPDLVGSIVNWCRARDSSVELTCQVQVVPGGERIKNNLKILDNVGSLSAKLGLDRHSYVVIIGGGAVLDAVGFAAATVHRGLRSVRIPTTVLSQGDSGVGVKNGLNRFGLKNFYGAFAPPVAVINDAEFLKTLKMRDWLSGVSEAFKVAIIKDRGFLDLLAENASLLRQRDQKAMEEVVRRMAIHHLDHIRSGGDAFETGSSRPLDFGHWAAHRIEEMTNYKLRHGEAVAIGVAIDILCAAQLGLVEMPECLYVLDAMERSGLSLWHKAIEKRSDAGDLEILTGIEHFRRHIGGDLTLTMPCRLGQKADIHNLPAEVVEHAVARLKQRSTHCFSTVRT